MKVVKGILKVIKWIIIVIVVLAVILVALYLYADNKPLFGKNFRDDIKTGGELEKKYLADGTYKVKKTTADAEKPIKKYTIYYPEELENSSKKYPMVLVVNQTGGKATKIEPMLEQFATWGFIVVGNQDKNTGTGETTITELKYMLNENENKDSIFYNKIDLNNIGLTGHSQGGAAVMNVITKYEEAKYFKAALPLSPVSEKTTREATNYNYDSSKVNIPIFIMAGTSGEFEIETVIPFEEFKMMYDKITSPKVEARRTDMTHDDMLYKAQGYVTAWFMWQLQGDEEASKVFVGDNPELLNNKLYQDQRIDLEVNTESSNEN